MNIIVKLSTRIIMSSPINIYAAMKGEHNIMSNNLHTVNFEDEKNIMA